MLLKTALKQRYCACAEGTRSGCFIQPRHRGCDYPSRDA